MKTERIEYQKMSEGKHLCITCLHCKNMKDGEAIYTTQDFVDFHPCDVIAALKDWKDDPRVQRIDNGGGYWVTMCNAYEYDKHWIDYNEYINSDFWKAKKLQVMKRDHWQCQECGTAKNLEVHHLDYKRLGFEDLYDLVTLCRDCHKKAHEHDLNKAEGGCRMSFYNMVCGFNPACVWLLPMLGKKHTEYPRFRDCFLSEDGKRIVIYTRVGGGNRNCGFGEEELYEDPNFVKTYDDDFDSTYGFYEFNVPDKWKDDFTKTTSGKFSELSDEYIEIIVQFYPELKDKILKICRGGEVAE